MYSAMSTPHEVACSFVPAFFELLASNPAALVEMYSHLSSLLVVDYEYGSSEARGADVYKAVGQWAQIVQGCQLSVDNCTTEPIYGGVSVFVSMTATSETVRHFFQLVTLLEACSAADCVPESYFIRHQIIIRPGSIAVEPPAEEPQPEPEEEEETPAEETVEKTVEETAATPAAPTPKKSRESPASTHSASTPAPAPAAPRATKTTWATLASAPPSKTEPRQPVKVISATNGSKADLTEAAAAPRKQDARDAGGAATKPHARAPRAPPAPVGDRLMFNINEAISDEDVRGALGTWEAQIVSLRNNSKKSGCVFLDFAPNAKVMDALKETQILVGPKKTRVNLYRQKSRE